MLKTVEISKGGEFWYCPSVSVMRLVDSETWYVKVSKTVATAAILKLLIGPDSSVNHPKIMSIQYKT